MLGTRECDVPYCMETGIVKKYRHPEEGLWDERVAIATEVGEETKGGGGGRSGGSKNCRLELDFEE